LAFSISTNLGALKAYNALAKVNSGVQRAQYRLATGKRINTVADDTSGFKVGKALESKTMIKKSQLNNASAAKDYLSTAETALLQINDLLIQISAKHADAQDSSKSKDSIADDIRSIASEIDSIMKTTKFNDTNLLAEADGSALTSSSIFDVGSDFSTDFASDSYLNAGALKTALHGGAETVSNTPVTIYDGTKFAKADTYSGGDQTSTIKATFSDGSTESINITLSGASTLEDVTTQTYTQMQASFDAGGSVRIGYGGGTLWDVQVNTENRKQIVGLETISGFDISTTLGFTREATITETSGGLLNNDTDAVLSAASDVTAITNNVRSALGRVGNLTQALDYKTDFLTSSITNNQSSISRLFDTDMASEQLNAAKGNIAGSAATSMLSQLNFAPQQLLQLLG